MANKINANKLLIQFAEQGWPKIIVAGVVALLLYWALYYNDGHGLQESLKQSQDQLEVAKKSLKQTKDAIANADRFEKEVKESIENFNRVIDFMPDKFNIADMTTIASELSSRAGTRLMKTEPREARSKVEFYDTTRLGFSLEGTFSQILMFLSYLSRVPKLMTFDNLELEVSSTSVDIETPRLNFNATLVGYKYIRPKFTEEALGKTPITAPATGAAPAAPTDPAGGAK